MHFPVGAAEEETALQGRHTNPQLGQTTLVTCSTVLLQGWGRGSAGEEIQNENQDKRHPKMIPP